MKKTIAILLALLMLASFAACAHVKPAEEEPGEQTPSEQSGGAPNEQIANPWEDCAALADAAKLAGFDIAIPSFEGYPNKVIQAIAGSTIQVMYFDGDPEAENSSAITVRKGNESGDISGDYNEYSESETVQMHGIDVQLRGEKGLVYSAIWNWDGCSFSIGADNGLSREAIADAVEQMITAAG